MRAISVGEDKATIWTLPVSPLEEILVDMGGNVCDSSQAHATENSHHCLLR